MSAALLGTLALLGLQTVAAETVRDPVRPNILVIMADDLGFSDLSPYGSEIRTPNIEALAKTGRIMTSMYATPMRIPRTRNFYSAWIIIRRSTAFLCWARRR